MKNNILNQALHTHYFQKLFQQYDVIMAIVGGSRLVNMISPTSDYDISLIVTDDCDYQKLLDRWCLRIDNQIIHAYICPLNSIELDHTGFSASLIKQYDISTHNIIWINPKYIKFVDTWCSLGPQLSYIGMLRYREQVYTHRYDKNTYAYILGADRHLHTNYGVICAQNWKEKYNTMDQQELTKYYQIFGNINSLLDQTGDNWRKLWKPIYELLKKTL